LKGSGKPVSCLGNLCRLEVDRLGLKGSEGMVNEVAWCRVSVELKRFVVLRSVVEKKAV
jgi:hypothetical protein